MRIQHNIMAMGAYRNYTNNLSAMKKNLEKLSSGYKINRAGDDAAGLAISEKMRAQITGLETAQKNAKDGISLVQTAEGALTEVHDMLNRMVELATQSANGTYDNETDRLQLQKEVAQLTDEINRIADSSNFNGIKLLDGSMDATPIAGALTNLKVSSGAITGELPSVGQLLGTDTVLHNKATDPTKAQFGVTLHNVSYSNDDVAGKMTIKFGDDKIELSGGATKATIDSGTITAVPTKMDLGGVEYEVEGDTVEEQLQSWVDQFNAETDFTAVPDAENFTAAVNGAGDGITLTAKTPGAVTTTLTGANAITPGANATVTATAHAAAATIAGDLGTATNIDWTDATTSIGSTGLEDLAGKTLTATLNGKTFTVELTKGAADAGSGKVQITEASKYSDIANAIQTELTALTTAENTAADAANSQITAAGAGRDTSYAVTLVFAANTAVTGSATDTYSSTTVAAGGEATTAQYALAGPADPVGQMTIAGKSYTVSKPDTDLAGQLQEWANKFNSDETNTDAADWVAKLNSTNDGIVFEAKATGEKDTTDAFITAAGGTLTNGTDSPFGEEGAMSADKIVAAIMNGVGNANVLLNGATIDDLNDITLSDGAHYKLEGNGYTLTFTQLDDDNGTAVLDRTVELQDRTGAKLENGKLSQDLKGDYNVSTSFNKPDTAASIDRLASTWFELDASKIADGTGVMIGGTTYKFSTDAEQQGAKDTVYIGDMLDAKGRFDGSATNMETLAERLTVAAKDNEVYTVNFDKANPARITVTETLNDEGVAYTEQEGAKYDLSKVDEIERSLGFVEADTPSEGKSLTLQIGDTAEEFNQLKVNIKDMHAKSLGLEGLDISTQDGAAAAVDKIKAAINTVSDVRGTLGATQNRLDHTINNLSVMTENIQDAESTIRDTDVAEEMMAYTKNNILIQSAQAMLAQANQVPQGVLQLLG